MSRFDTLDPILPTVPAANWRKPAAADDIVDPVEAGDGFVAHGAIDDLGREQTDEEAEDVPLDIQLTDALSMVAQGGHSYGATPLAAGDFAEEREAEGLIDERTGERPDLDAIDESSKDA